MTDALPHVPDMPDLHGLWLSISDLAARKGVTKQSMSERVARFEAGGSLTTRPGPRRSKLVNLAEYDRAASENSFPAQQLAAQTVRQRAADAAAANFPPRSDAGRLDDAGRSADPTLTEAHARKAGIEMELKKLDLAERRGALVAIAGPRGVEAAQIRAGMAIVRALERIPARAAEVTAAAMQGGEHAVRRLLRQFVVEAREVMAGDLGALKAEGLGDEGAGPYDVEIQLEDA